MRKLIFQYSGHLMWRTDSFEKDPDAGKDWRQEEKGTTEDEMVGWHHWCDGHEFEQALGVGDGQGGLACCSPRGRKESDTIERQGWTECWLRNLLQFHPPGFPHSPLRVSSRAFPGPPRAEVTQASHSLLFQALSPASPTYPPRSCSLQLLLYNLVQYPLTRWVWSCPGPGVGTLCGCEKPHVAASQPRVVPPPNLSGCRPQGGAHTTPCLPTDLCLAQDGTQVFPPLLQHGKLMKSRASIVSGTSCVTKTGHTLNECLYSEWVRKRLTEGANESISQSINVQSDRSKALGRALTELTGFPGGVIGKESACQGRSCKRWVFDSWVGKIPWNRKGQPTPGIRAWEIPWTEELGGPQAIGLQTGGHNSPCACAYTHTDTQWDN